MDGLIDTYHIRKSRIKVLPFYPPVQPDGNSYKRTPNTFLYVSSGSPHKNQEFLIESFCQFYDQQRIGKLTLTINNSHQSLIEVINSKVQLGYPISNVGFVPHSEMYALYHTHEYLVFPSKAESF